MKTQLKTQLKNDIAAIAAANLVLDRAARVAAVQSSLGALRGDLLRFAALRLRDRDGAERCAAGHLDGSARRSVNVGSLSDDGDHTRVCERLFNERGHWTPEATPLPWREPEAALSEHEFYAVFEACLQRLPEIAAEPSSACAAAHAPVGLSRRWQFPDAGAMAAAVGTALCRWPCSRWGAGWSA